MKIIVLQGVSNSGKTTSIKDVITRLFHDDWQIAPPPPFNRIRVLKDRNDLLSKVDVTVFLEKPPRLIGITSFGDTVTCVEPKIDLFIAKGCEKCIVGGHDTPKFTALWDKYKSAGHTVYIVPQTKAQPPFAQANTATAKKLIFMI